MLSREFAGEVRELGLRTPRNWPTVRVGCYETDRFGSLAALVELSVRRLLGDGHTRHIIAHALAGPDNPVGLLKAHRLVEEEMRGKPLAPFQALAIDIIADAYAEAGDG